VSPRFWAVIIGIGKYANAAIPQLKYAKSDAHAIHGYLIHEGAFPRSSGDALHNSASPPHATSTKLILDVNVPGRYHAHA